MNPGMRALCEKVGRVKRTAVRWMLSSSGFLWTVIAVLICMVMIALSLGANVVWQLMVSARFAITDDWMGVRAHWMLGIIAVVVSIGITLLDWRLLNLAWRILARRKTKSGMWKWEPMGGLLLDGDHPADEDELGRESFVEMLAAVLKGTRVNAEGSSYMALYGRWGEGKTTVCNMLRKKCRDSGLLFVDFNPWQGEGEGHLAEQLFDALARGVLKRNASGAKLARQLRLFGVQLAGSWRMRRMIFSLPVFGGVLEKAFGDEDAEAVAIRQLNGLLESVRAEYRIVVVVDDLDRMPAAEVCSVIRLIRTHANLKNITYLVLADREHVARAIGQKLGTGDDMYEGDLFLEKIFPLAFDLPQIAPMRLEKIFLAKLTDVYRRHNIAIRNVDDEKWQIVRYYLTDLRKVKRLVNALDAQFYYVAQNATGGLSVCLDDFMVVTAMRVFDREVFNRVYDNKGNLLGTVDGEHPEKLYRYKATDLMMMLCPNADDLHKDIIMRFLRACLGVTRVATGSTGIEFFSYGLTGQQIQKAEANYLLCAPSIFDNYFTGFVDERVKVTVAEYDEFISLLPSLNSGLAFCNERLKEGRLYDFLVFSKCRGPFKREQLNRSMLHILARLGDYSLTQGVEFPHGYLALVQSKSPMHQLVWAYFQMLLDGMKDAERRSKIVREIICESDGVYVAKCILDVEGQAFVDVAALTGDGNIMGTYLTVGDYRGVREVYLRSITRKFSEGNFDEHLMVSELVQSWIKLIKDHPQSDVLQADMESVLNEKAMRYPEARVAIMPFIKEARSDAKHWWERIIDYDEMQKVIDVDTLLDTLGRIEAQQALPVDWLYFYECVKLRFNYESSGARALLNPNCDWQNLGANTMKALLEREKHPELGRGVMFSRDVSKRFSSND